MAYNFSKTSNSLIATLDTESGKYDEHIIEFFQPVLSLGQDRIVLSEGSLRKLDLVFGKIGEIDGETPSNLIDGFEILESFIKSIFVSSNDVTSIKTYKAYVTNDVIIQTSGLLVEGTYYGVDSFEDGDDFSNVGYSGTGSGFVATGTTPTAWTNGTSIYHFDINIQVVQNTLSETLFIEFGLDDSGEESMFYKTTDVSFVENKIVYQSDNSNNYVFIDSDSIKAGQIISEKSLVIIEVHQN